MDKPAISLSEAVAWAGSRAELARRLGVTSQAVSQWNELPEGRLWQLAAIWGQQNKATGDAKERAE